MTDYQPLIARAVDGLAKNTGEARRALYERARSALVTQLRSVEPALPESEITKERLALEEAIRKVEAEAAHKTLSETRSQMRTEPRLDIRSRLSRTALPRAGASEPAHTEEAAEEPPGNAAPPKLSARDRILQARAATHSAAGRSHGGGFGKFDSVRTASAKLQQPDRSARDGIFGGLRRRGLRTEGEAEPEALQFDPDGSEPHAGPSGEAADTLQLDSLEPAEGLEEEQAVAELPQALRPNADEAAYEEYEPVRPPRSYGKWIRIAILLLVAIGIGAGVNWQWSTIVGIYQFFTQRPQAPTQTAQTTPPEKYPGRVPQEQIPGQPPAAGTAPEGQQAPAVAQKAILYEADANDPNGKQFPGSVTWRTDTVSPGPGLGPELVVRAAVEIPERHMSVTLTLSRNTDKALPASHTMQVMFNLPADFPGGGISIVPGILMRDAAQLRGIPLAATSVKVTPTYFLFGLSSDEASVQRNVQLLKDRGTFDIGLVYANGNHAILTMEKGPAGDHVFAEAFAAWGQ